MMSQKNEYRTKLNEICTITYFKFKSKEKTDKSKEKPNVKKYYI